MGKDKYYKYSCIFLFTVLLITSGNASDTIPERLPFFKPSLSYHKKRAAYAATLASTAYTTFSIGFYNAWYKNYPMSSFHLFNDYGEWNQMDKAGHVFSGYFQSLLVHQGARWAGLSDGKAMLSGIIASTMFQTTMEVMDGFSDQWGFSLGDVAGNTIGLSAFYFQQKYWKEQKITLKESSWPRTYDNRKFKSTDGKNEISLRERAAKLYGTSWGEKALKDYNVQIYWASFNPRMISNDWTKWPQWLNLAVGYGADNLYGGFNNKFEIDGYAYDFSQLKRQRQYYLALDYDLRKVKTKNHFVKTMFNILNIYKFPAPALEYNSQEGLKFHLLLIH